MNVNINIMKAAVAVAVTQLALAGCGNGTTQPTGSVVTATPKKVEFQASSTSTIPSAASVELTDKWCKSPTRLAMFEDMRNIGKRVTVLLYYRMLGKDPSIYRYDEWKDGEIVQGYTGEGGITLNGVSSPEFSPSDTSMFAWVKYNGTGSFDPKLNTNHFSVGAYLPRLEKHVEVSVIFNDEMRLSDEECEGPSIYVSEAQLRSDGGTQTKWARSRKADGDDGIPEGVRLQERNAYDLMKEIVSVTELAK